MLPLTRDAYAMPATECESHRFPPNICIITLKPYTMPEPPPTENLAASYVSAESHPTSVRKFGPSGSLGARLVFQIHFGIGAMHM